MRKGLAIAFAAALAAGPALASDARDAAFLADVMNQRLESQRSGTTVIWSNPLTGNSGTVTILGTDESDPEIPCRTYRLTTETPGRPPIIIEGRGCRVVPGVWQRTEAPVSATPSAERPVAAPAAPPPEIPPPGRKPDPDIFFASVPTPSDYR